MLLRNHGSSRNQLCPQAKHVKHVERLAASRVSGKAPYPMTFCYRRGPSAAAAAACPQLCRVGFTGSDQWG
jgi:hypothetical protein